jgi:integrase
MMPTMYGEGSLSQRRTGAHAGRWEYRRTVDGRRRTATWDRKPTRAMLTAKIAEWSNTSDLPLGDTVADFLDRWLRDGTTDLRGRTVRGYRLHVETSITPHLGALRLDALSTPVIQRWINEGATAHDLSCLRSALGTAVRWGLLTWNPARGVRLPKRERTEPLILSPEQTRTLLKQVKGDPLAPLFMLAAYTGMRQGEILGLRWKDIDLRSGTLSVTRSLWWKPGPDGCTPTLTEPKTKRSRRSIVLHPAVIEALTEHRRLTMLSSPDGLVFTKRGTALWPGTVYQALRPHEKAAGLPLTNFHSLRHGAASMLLESGWDVMAVSELLGHSSPTVTMSVYAHSIEKRRSETAARMGELLTSTGV